MIPRVPATPSPMPAACPRRDLIRCQRVGKDQRQTRRCALSPARAGAKLGLAGEDKRERHDVGGQRSRKNRRVRKG